jgi:hypothetical protein
METLTPKEFLKQLEDVRESYWEKMNAERKSYGAEKPLTAAIVLRRLQFGVVMERKSDFGSPRTVRCFLFRRNLVQSLRAP